MQASEGTIRNLKWVMILLALLVSFSFQGTRGLYETTEGRYAECAREMIESGNYLEPALDYKPHWTKPPLTYWAIAGGIKLLGRSEWGVRFYDAVAFFLTVLVVSAIGKALWGETAGYIAGLIYLSSPFPVCGACAVSTDTLLTLWELCAVLCYLMAYKVQSETKSFLWIPGMWIFFGLGFLTKGPPALIPLVPICIWNFRNSKKVKLTNPIGILLFMLIGFSWYLIVCFKHPGLLSYFLEREVVARVASSSFHRNSEWYKPFVIYLPLLTFGAGPWLYFGFKTGWEKWFQHPARLQREKTTPGIGKSRTDIFMHKGLRLGELSETESLRDGVSPRRSPTARRGGYRGIGPAMLVWERLKGKSFGSFLLIWFLLPLIIFFVVKSRLPLYVLPLYAPLALATARGISFNQKGRVTLRKVTTVAIVSAILLIGVKGFSSMFPSKRNMKPLYQMCRSIGGKNGKFAVLNRKKIFGLQYYLEGHLKRVSSTGKEPWADASISSVLKKARKSSSRNTYVFIAKKKQGPALYNLLSNSHLPFVRYDSKFWTLYRLEDCLVTQNT